MKTSFQMQLVLLVLMNVAFVQITGAVGLNWIIPLYLATLAAPFLRRFHDALWYRLGWNVGVVLIFSILLTDATTTGITFLLEDGLILAAFCQVHLVNVIKRQTGADLLFFNSFLITLVTSLFCQDIVFSVVFAVYAVVLLVALHTSTVARTPPPEAKRVARRVARQGVRRAMTVLALTGIVFVVFPRDFRRTGIVTDDLLDPLDSSQVGFAEEIRLGQSSRMTVNRRVVMRIRALDGNHQAIPELWRGATLSYYDRNGWQGVHMPQTTTLTKSDGGWADDSSTVWRRGNAGSAGSRFEIECTTPVPKRLFLPLGAHEVRLTRPSYVDPLIDGTLRYDSGPPLTYQVGFANDGLDATTGVRLASYRHLSREVIPAELGQRLAEAVQSLGSNPSRREVVQACSDYLSSEYSYLLPGERGAARDIDEFLSGTGGGHCEYFATALALMLRLRQIPCRVVTGYRVHEWNEEAQCFVVRDSHAHAWVEVWDDEFGWLSADATPAAEIELPEENWWAAARADLQQLWAALVGFDGKSHEAAIDWLLSTPSRSWNTMRTHPATFAGFAAAAIALFAWRRRRRDADRVTRAYETALRAAGIERRPAETPREVLARAETGQCDAERIAELRFATARHEALRYDGFSE